MAHGNGDVEGVVSGGERVTLALTESPREGYAVRLLVKGVASAGTIEVDMTSSDIVNLFETAREMVRRKDQEGKAL